MVAAVAVMLGLLGPGAVRVGAFDLPAYTGRIETRYSLEAGDNAFDHDLYNYHSLQLSFSRNLTFSWYGGIIASLSPTVNTLANGIETSDNALRSLQDAGNPGQYVNYTIYSTYLKYDAGLFGATLGRSNPEDYQLIFDGLTAWVSPFEWLKLNALGGVPWHYSYVANPFNAVQNWQTGELAVGGGAEARFLNDVILFSATYLFLREVTDTSGQIGSVATYLSSDSLTRASVSFSPWPWLSGGAGGSFLDLSPLSARAWLSGSIEPIHLSYSADFEAQMIGVSAVSDRFTEFSSILTASDPYLDASVTLTEDFAGFMRRGGLLSDVELDLTYEHRQPVSPADQSMFNPQYDQFRVATMLGAAGGWSLQAFFTVLLTSGLQNDLYVVGGELGRKWSSLDVRLGSSFNASLYETDYTQTVLQDSFYAQEYYLKVKWQITRSVDVSVKGGYENILLTSITSGVPLNPAVQSAPMTTLNDGARSYFRFELRTSFRY
jgi:hypothetical protein